MTCWVRDERALWQRTSRRVLVAGATGGASFELGALAVLVWDAVAEPVDLDDLVADLADVFSVPAERIRADLEGPLADLASAGAIRRC